MWTIRALILLVAASVCFLLNAPAFAISTSPTSIYLAETAWTYQDLTGPDYWAELDPTFEACGSGKGQSPINLTAAESADLVNPNFHYEPVPLNILNNGHTVQVPYAPGSFITLDGQHYNLLQFHFHSPSEHAVDGQPWDAELHLVHQNEVGDIAVVAVLLQADDVNASIQYAALSEQLPAKAGEKLRTEKMINAQKLLPDKTTTYRYSGSLTTPPCSESVTWLVMTEPVSLSAAEIDGYKKLLNHNNRPLQLLNSRAVQMDMSP